MANFEIITNPQVFLGGLTALGPGIQGLTEQYPLLTTYQYWTSTANVDTTEFPIPGTWSIYGGPNKEASFIVTVGGIVQTPVQDYIIDDVLRKLTFTTTVSAGIEIAATQLATAAPSSESLNYLQVVNSVLTNLTASSLLVTNLTALSTTVNGFRSLGDVQIDGNTYVTNITLSDTGSLLGSTSATSIRVGVLSAREIDLVHTPANDGIDPILDIGETTTDGFSGFRVRYDESNNRLLVQTLVAGVSSNSVIIDRTTGQVGISAVPNHALTVAGNISATGFTNINVNAGTATTAPITLKSGTLLTTPEEGAIEYASSCYFVTPATGGRGIIQAPQWVRVNTNRLKTNNNPILEGVFDAGNDTISLIANTLYYFKGFYHIQTASSTVAHQAQIGFNITPSQQDIWYEYRWQTGTSNTSSQNTGLITTNITLSIGASQTAPQVVLIGFEGYLKSNASTGSTLMPVFTQSQAGTSSAPLMNAGSWFLLQPVGGVNNTVLAGNWF